MCDGATRAVQHRKLLRILGLDEVASDPCNALHCTNRVWLRTIHGLRRSTYGKREAALSARALSFPIGMRSLFPVPETEMEKK
jgi:hypothetical protein